VTARGPRQLRRSSFSDTVNRASEAPQLTAMGRVRKRRGGRSRILFLAEFPNGRRRVLEEARRPR
jgi:hypothetical protein